MLLKETALLRLLGLRIPMLLFVGPRVVELDDGELRGARPAHLPDEEPPPHRRDVLQRALRRRRPRPEASPLGEAHVRKYRSMRLVFGEMRAEFLKRADSDVLFRNRDGRRVTQAVQQAAMSGSASPFPSR